MVWRQLVFICTAWVFAGCAQLIGIEDLPEEDPGMYSDHGPRYPMFEYEGGYPEDTPCNGMFELLESNTGTYEGYEITLEYFYHDDCGSFAQITNAPESCAVILHRSTDEGMTWTWIREFVEPDLDFAYTQMGNNLEGRFTRGVLACDDEVLVRTDWW